MDTSEIYIKLCREAEEIQRGSPIKYLNGDLYTEYELTSFFWLPKKHSLEILKLDTTGQLIVGAADADLEGAVWLPRQDQLQSMYLREMKCSNSHSQVYRATVDIFSWYNAVQSGHHRYTSMEQLWLAFYMKSVYNKTWEGQVWKSPPK